MAQNILLPPTPSRLLFIASIGNKHPYRQTRHSAGHILLDAVIPLLASRISNSNNSSSNGNSTASHRIQPQLTRKSLPSSLSSYYTTWHSPTYMNESGPKLVRQFDDWISKMRMRMNNNNNNIITNTHTQKDPIPTLVILHDELESALGKLRIRKGGPEQASLRGHRGLISIMESLRGKGLLRPSSSSSTPSSRSSSSISSKANTTSVTPPVGSSISILRIGVGIGRPSNRKSGAVADYVLTQMSTEELSAVQAAAGSVVDVLVDEFYGLDE